MREDVKRRCAIAYLRRQAYSGNPAEVYISANPRFCASYDRWHDYKLPTVIHGASESPVLISYTGNTVIVHSPEPVVQPWLARPSYFSVMFEKAHARGVRDVRWKWAKRRRASEVLDES
jgi:hypothetical protein